jgi:hypothetical protein
MLKVLRTQVDDVVAAYAAFLEKGIKPGHITFAGDSAGAGLSVTGWGWGSNIGISFTQDETYHTLLVQLKVFADGRVGCRRHKACKARGARRGSVQTTLSRLPWTNAPGSTSPRLPGQSQ